jgi:hypothetical protein
MTQYAVNNSRPLKQTAKNVIGNVSATTKRCAGINHRPDDSKGSKIISALAGELLKTGTRIFCVFIGR